MLRDDTFIPDWVTGLTAQRWDGLPESLCKRLEVVDGSIIFGPPANREHCKAVSLLWAALRRPAAQFAAAENQCIDSSPSADLRFEDERNGAISTVTWYALPEDDKRYEVRACWTPAETPDGIRADEPFPVRIAWDELAF